MGMQGCLVIALLVCVSLAHAQTCDEVITNPYTKVWLIAVGHDYGGFEYFNEAGYLEGFSYDLIRAVCTAARINCRTVWETYVRCWDTTEHAHPVGGIGLLGGWYDACASWVATVDRIHVYDFSMPYAKNNPAYFYTKRGDTTFNAYDISNKKIGFLDGFSSDEKCVARLTDVTGHFLPQGSVVYYKESTQLVKAIQNDEVAAGFCSYETMDPFVTKGEISQVSSRDFFCAIHGPSMMTRKDNGIIPHWNRGFQKVRNTGDFGRLCKDADLRHGKAGKMNCVDT